MEWLVVILLVLFFLFEIGSANNHNRKNNRQQKDEKDIVKSRGRYSSKAKEGKTEESWKIQEANNEAMRKAEPLKARGDGYELHIGRMFERKGDLVIYNGFLRGFEDQGVDLIVLPKGEQAINLVQCKHWQRFEFTPEHLRQIHQKLCNYQRDYISLKPEAIKQYLATHFTDMQINQIMSVSYQYPMRKTLYLASKQVISQEAEGMLTLITNNIYRYEDMKVVIYSIQ
jgi:hypothetical protein